MLIDRMGTTSSVEVEQGHYHGIYQRTARVFHSTVTECLRRLEQIEAKVRATSYPVKQDDIVVRDTFLKPNFYLVRDRGALLSKYCTARTAGAERRPLKFEPSLGYYIPDTSGPLV